MGRARRRVAIVSRQSPAAIIAAALLAAFVRGAVASAGRREPGPDLVDPTPRPRDLGQADVVEDEPRG